MGAHWVGDVARFRAAAPDPVPCPCAPCASQGINLKATEMAFQRCTTRSTGQELSNREQACIRDVVTA